MNPGLQVLWLSNCKVSNPVVGSHSCERACHPVLSTQDRIHIMITGRPKCNTLWRIKVGQHTQCQTPLCHMNHWRYNFNKLPASPLDVDTRLQSLLSIPSIAVGKLTIFTFTVCSWGTTTYNLLSCYRFPEQYNHVIWLYSQLSLIWGTLSHIAHTKWLSNRKNSPISSEKTLVFHVPLLTLVLATHLSSGHPLPIL